MPPDQRPPRLLLRSELIAAGHSANEIRIAVATGRLTAVRRGAYCESDTVTSLGEVERHLLRARAVAGRSPDLVVSHISAAAAHGWPIWDAALGRVHVIRRGPGGNQLSAERVVHSGRLAPDELSSGSGMPVTAPARTIVDLARSSSLETALWQPISHLHQRQPRSPTWARP